MEQKVRLGGTCYTENPIRTVSVQQSIPTGVPAYDFEALNDPLWQVRTHVGNHMFSDITEMAWFCFCPLMA